MILRTKVLTVVCLALVACERAPDIEVCEEPGDRERKPFQVKLEVVADSGGNHHLVVTEPQCTRNPTQRGCVTVPRNSVGEITFQLLNGVQNCPPAGPVKWKLKGVQLSLQAKAPTPVVDEAVKCDFGTDDQGNVQNLVFPGGPRMQILDRNNEAYYVYYTVSAESCDPTGEIITTDPWIENKGRN